MEKEPTRPIGPTACSGRGAGAAFQAVRAQGQPGDLLDIWRASASSGIPGTGHTAQASLVQAQGLEAEGWAWSASGKEGEEFIAACSCFGGRHREMQPDSFGGRVGTGRATTDTIPQGVRVNIFTVRVVERWRQQAPQMCQL